MIEVIDNFLPTDVAIRLSERFFADPTWSAEWNRELERNQQTGGWNWHRSIGGDELYGDIALESIPGYMQPLYARTQNQLQSMIPFRHKIERMYSNSHTYGTDGPCHTDDGVLTVLYYPCQDWDIQWEGGTVFYNEERTDVVQYAAYKFNRAVVFKSNIPHKAMPVTRDCYKLRTSIVFKTDADPNDPAYARWFYNESMV